MYTVFCDEAGNSGENLFDNDQPIFVLASNDYSRSEAVELLQHVNQTQGGEPKFTNLRKTASGIGKLTKLLSDPRLNKSRVVVDVFHKRYMVYTKIVDLVFETLMHQSGLNLYLKGGNIAMANMLYQCMPTFCGEEATEMYLRAFVMLLRKRTQADREEFIAAGKCLRTSCIDPKFLELIRPMTNEAIISRWFDKVPAYSLEPAIPALFEHIVEWGRRKADRFEVIHDASKSVFANKQLFHDMMATFNDPANTIGYDRRKFSFPLKSTSLEPGDSKLVPQLQLADLCAGSINHFMRCQEKGVSDAISQAVQLLGCLEWGINAVLPGTEVTADQLGMTSTDGVDPADAIADYLRQKRGE